MITINAEQMAAFEHDAQSRYAEDLCARLLALYPGEAGALGPVALRQLVDDGIARARGYNLDSERDIALFVDLSLFLGSGFDQDPELPWAAEILTDDYITESELRIDTLHARALDHLDGVDSTPAEGQRS